MNKQTIVKSVALSSLLAVGATACTPFQASNMDSGHKNTSKVAGAKCGSGGCGGKKADAKCGEGKCGDSMKKHKDGGCGGKHKDGSCGSK